MSRWFRHYAGMMRDEKLVRAAIKSGQSIERVIWVWGAILESAAEIDDNGRHDFNVSAASYFLHVSEGDISTVIEQFHASNMLDGDAVVDWVDYSRHCIRLPWSTWATIRLSVFQRDNYTCRYCGAHGVKLECDHIVPISRGGTNDKTNLVAACQPCNRAKRDRCPEELGWSV